MNRPTGIVLEVAGGVYRVLLDDEVEVSASLRGRLKQEPRSGGRVVPGDRVRLVSEVDAAPGTDGNATIEEVLPRTSELLRAGFHGRGEKIVAANVDRVLVVLSATHPPFRRDSADRYLTLAALSDIPAILVLNKSDLVEDRLALETDLGVYRKIGYTVILTSARTGEGCDELSRLLSDGASLLIGPSGVGKSSLINALDPDFALRVGGVGRTGRGKHTTVGARLLPLTSGGWVVDTPGFSDATHVHVELEFLAGAFPEFAGAAEECRFSGCTHLHEPGCSVQEAVEEGRIAASRYESYRTMAEDLREREER